MSTRTFINNAAKTKDTWTITVGGTWIAGETITIPVGSKSLVITIGSLVTTSQVATTIRQAWESISFSDDTASCLPQDGGASIPEMAQLTATVNGSVVTITADTAGIAHTISSLSESSASGTVTLNHTVTATGPWHGDNTANWLEGALPVDGDDIVIDGPYKWLYGTAFSSVQPASITFGERCTRETQVGLPWTNALGYNEYLSPELLIGPAIINVRGPVGLCKISCGTDEVHVNVYNSGTSLETGYAPIQIRGTHVDNEIHVYGGSASWAGRGETATLSIGRQYGGRLSIGKGTTYTELSGNITITQA